MGIESEGRLPFRKRFQFQFCSQRSQRSFNAILHLLSLFLPAIEASGLTKIYRPYRKERGFGGWTKGFIKRRHDETRAADNITFQIEQGEIVGFLGPNGAGKTTVLKML